MTTTKRIPAEISWVALLAMTLAGASCATSDRAPEPRKQVAASAARDNAASQDRLVSDVLPQDRVRLDGVDCPPERLGPRIKAIDEAHRDPGDSEFDLIAAGDRSAAEGKYVEALESWRQALLVRIPKERDLPFRFPVPAEFLTRTALRERILAEMKKDHADEDARRQELAFKQFGLIPPDCDWVAAQTSVLEEQIAGFYDPDTKRLYLIREDPDAPKKHGFLSSLFGSKPSFNPQEQKVFLVHEMEHALADQHFDLFSIHKSVTDDDDMALAIAALIEGEATMLMFMDAQGSRGRVMLGLPPETLAALGDALTSFTNAFAGGKALSDAPLVLRETLVFPYLRGWCFVGALTQDKKWDQVDAAFHDLPTSTEQILHPMKYAAATRDEARTITFNGVPPLLEDWELVTENCMGEFQIELLLRPAKTAPESKVAAAGWGGDRYRVYRRKESDPAETLSVWVTTWDTEEDAIEFEAALVQARAPEGAVADSADSLWCTWSTGTTMSGIRRSSTEVLFLDDVPKDVFDAVAGWSTVYWHGRKQVTVTKATPSTPFPPD